MYFYNLFILVYEFYIEYFLLFCYFIPVERKQEDMGLLFQFYLLSTRCAADIHKKIIQNIFSE